MIKKVKHKKNKFLYGIQEEFLCFYLKKVLLVGGYKYRKISKDWIKDEKDGRFHFTQSIKKEGVLNLHYDTWGETCDHYSIPMPFKVTKELKRLSAIDHSLKNKYAKPKRVE